VGFVIAVDGPAASGKGTIASRLGEMYHLAVLDSGLLYRAIGLAVIDAGGDLDSEIECMRAAGTLDFSNLTGARYRTRIAGEAASRIAVHPAVRQTLIDLQREFARQEPGAVIDGRDIGTVIVPDAPVKIYVTASQAARATRRWRQLVGLGEETDYDVILTDVQKRDVRDAARLAAPMRPADDAVLLDTTDLDIAGAFDAARRIVEDARARWEQSQNG
jgi:cytidylate kinase